MNTESPQKVCLSQSQEGQDNERSSGLDHAKVAMVKQERCREIVDVNTGGSRWASVTTHRVVCDAGILQRLCSEATVLRRQSARDDVLVVAEARLRANSRGVEESRRNGRMIWGARRDQCLGSLLFLDRTDETHPAERSKQVSLFNTNRKSVNNFTSVTQAEGANSNSTCALIYALIAAPSHIALVV